MELFDNTTETTDPQQSQDTTQQSSSGQSTNQTRDQFRAEVEAFRQERAGITRKQVPDLITKVAKQEGVDPNEVLALSQYENNFNPIRTSRTGARGPMQVLTSTGLGYVTPEEFDTVEGQVRAGVRFYKDLRNQYGNPRQAYGAYLTGPGRMNIAIRQGEELPNFSDPTTGVHVSDYVDSIMSNLSKMQPPSDEDKETAAFRDEVENFRKEYEQQQSAERGELGGMKYTPLDQGMFGRPPVQSPLQTQFNTGFSPEAIAQAARERNFMNDVRPPQATNLAERYSLTAENAARLAGASRAQEAVPMADFENVDFTYEGKGNDPAALRKSVYEKLGLTKQAEELKKHGIELLEFPVTDPNTGKVRPATDEELTRYAKQVQTESQAGHDVYGVTLPISRAAMIAAQVFKQSGGDVEAYKRVVKAMQQQQAETQAHDITDAERARRGDPRILAAANTGFGGETTLAKTLQYFRNLGSLTPQEMAERFAGNQPEFDKALAGYQAPLDKSLAGEIMQRTPEPADFSGFLGRYIVPAAADFLRLSATAEALGPAGPAAFQVDTFVNNLHKSAKDQLAEQAKAAPLTLAGLVPGSNMMKSLALGTTAAAQTVGLEGLNRSTDPTYLPQHNLEALSQGMFMSLMPAIHGFSEYTAMRGSELGDVIGRYENRIDKLGKAEGVDNLSEKVKVWAASTTRNSEMYRDFVDGTMDQNHPMYSILTNAAKSEEGEEFINDSAHLADSGEVAYAIALKLTHDTIQTDGAKFAAEKLDQLINFANGTEPGMGAARRVLTGEAAPPTEPPKPGGQPPPPTTPPGTAAPPPAETPPPTTPSGTTAPAGQPPPGLDAQSSEEYRLMRGRLADPTLADKGVAVKYHGGTTFAVPLGGSRTAGSLDFQTYDKDEALAMMKQLQNKPGFPNLRVVNEPTVEGDNNYVVRWGAELSRAATGAPLDRIHGRQFGYSESAINGFTGNIPDEAPPAPTPAAPPPTTPNAPPETPTGTRPGPPPPTQPLTGDDLYQEAIKHVRELGRGSTILLQRRLKIGYGRAVELLDRMVKDGIIEPRDPANSSAPQMVIKKGGGPAIPLGPSDTPAGTAPPETAPTPPVTPPAPAPTDPEARYKMAVDLIRNSGKVSAATLQRGMGLGYGDIQKLLDRMEQEGIITKDADGKRVLAEQAAPTAPEQKGDFDGISIRSEDSTLLNQRLADPRSETNRLYNAIPASASPRDAIDTFDRHAREIGVSDGSRDTIRAELERRHAQHPEPGPETVSTTQPGSDLGFTSQFHHIYAGDTAPGQQNAAALNQTNPGAAMVTDKRWNEQAPGETDKDYKKRIERAARGVLMNAGQRPDERFAVAVHPDVIKSLGGKTDGPVRLSVDEDNKLTTEPVDHTPGHELPAGVYLIPHGGAKPPATKPGPPPPTTTPEHKLLTNPAEINSKVWYHGTATEGLTPEKLDPALTKLDNLFGEGIYLTDNPDIAKGYAEARAKREGTPTVYQTKVNVQNVLNLEDPASPEFIDHITDLKNTIEQWSNGQGYFDSFEEALGKPNVTAETLYLALSNDLSTLSQQDQIPTYEFAEDFSRFAAQLRKDGFDAFTHTGGKRTGKAPHQVLVMLDPNDIYSETGRPGTVTSMSSLGGTIPAPPPGSTHEEPSTKSPTTVPTSYDDTAAVDAVSESNAGFKDAFERFTDNDYSDHAAAQFRAAAVDAGLDPEITNRIVRHVRGLDDPRVIAAAERIQSGNHSPAAIAEYRAAATAAGLYPDLVENFIAEEKGKADKGTVADAGQQPAESEQRLVPRQPNTAPHYGNDTTIVIPGENLEIPARYVVHENEDVQGSHDADFNPNQKYELENTRQYHKEPTYQMELEENSKPGVFKEQRVINNSDTIETGPPAIEPNRNVLGGNSRKILIDRHYRSGGTAYRDKLIQDAAIYGLDPEKIKQFKNPILSREISDVRNIGELQDLIRKLNVTGTRALTAAEEAMASSKGMPEHTVQYISDTIRLAGEDATLNEVLDTHGGDIIERLIDDGVFQPTERNALLRDGKPTDAAKARIARMLTAKVFRDLDQYNRAPDSIRNNVTRIAAPMLKFAGDPDWDITDEVRNAIDMVTEAMATGNLKAPSAYKTADGAANAINSFAKQKTIDNREPYTPRETALAIKIHAGPRKAAVAFNKYANDFVLKQQGGGLFGPATPEEAFNDAFDLKPGDAGTAPAPTPKPPKKQPKKAPGPRPPKTQPPTSGPPEQPPAAPPEQPPAGGPKTDITDPNLGAGNTTFAGGQELQDKIKRLKELKEQREGKGGDFKSSSMVMRDRGSREFLSSRMGKKSAGPNRDQVIYDNVLSQNGEPIAKAGILQVYDGDGSVPAVWMKEIAENPAVSDVANLLQHTFMIYQAELQRYDDRYKDVIFHGLGLHPEWGGMNLASQDIAKTFGFSSAIVINPFRILRGAAAKLADRKPAPSLAVKRRVVAAHLASVMLHELTHQVNRDELHSGFGTALTENIALTETQTKELTDILDERLSRYDNDALRELDRWAARLAAHFAVGRNVGSPSMGRPGTRRGSPYNPGDPQRGTGAGGGPAETVAGGGKFTASRMAAGPEGGSNLPTPEEIDLWQDVAGSFLEAGITNFEEFSNQMQEISGDVVLPYLRELYNSAAAELNLPPAPKAQQPPTTPGPRPPTTTPEGARPPPIEQTLETLPQKIADHFAGNNGFGSIVEARAFAGEHLGQRVEPGTDLAKKVDEAVELGAVIQTRNIIAKGGTPQSIMAQIVNLYQNQMPNLSVRTSTSVANQAYSTPPPLAYVATQLAGVTDQTELYEPTAGQGILTIGADPKNVHANEINPDRVKALQQTLPGARITSQDATTLNPPKVDTVIANPPFGSVTGPNGQPKLFRVTPEYSTRAVDHAIAMKALEGMQDNGSAVLIVGGVPATDPEGRYRGYQAQDKRAFYYNLYNGYNVVDHFTVNGDLYKKQGAGWPVDVVVIRGRGKSERQLPAVDLPRILNNWDEVGTKLGKAVQLNEQYPIRLLDAERGGEQSEGGGNQGPSESDTGRGDIRSTSGGEDTAPGGNLEGNEPGGNVPDTETGRPDGEQTGPADGGREPDTGEPLHDKPAEQDGGPGTTPEGTGEQPGGGTGVPRDDTGGVGDRGNRELDESGQVKEPEKLRPESSQVPYHPGSENPNALGSLIPVNMATATQTALENLKQQVGSLDQYVADTLGYDLSDIYGTPEKEGAWNAEQVDALALALHALENGKGFIIGDQTGLGKGRVVSGIIWYAKHTGRQAIFVTEKAGLYSDIFRDLTDIGKGHLRFVATNNSLKLPLSRNEDVVLKTPEAEKHNEELQEMMQNNKLQGGDVIVTTYSQMMKDQDEPETVRRNFLRHFANGGIVIFDESHNAGGTGEKRDEQGDLIIDRAAFARELAQNAHGVFFSSATFAKRADVMDLYASTDLSLAVSNPRQIAPMIEAGGVPMQQVVSAMLAESGQMIRRERSYDGINYNTDIVPIHRESAAGTSRSMLNIHRFSTMIPGIIAQIRSQFASQGSVVTANQATQQVSIKNTNFSSLMHNVVNQMLLALKMDAAIDKAIELLKKNIKPVITVANTMGSFLEQYAKDNNLEPGDPIPVEFGDILHRYLEKARTITIKDASGNKRKHYLTDEQLGPRGLAAYNRAKDTINSVDWSFMPVSPIDHIIMRMRKAGYNFGEITGRLHAVEYPEPPLPTTGQLITAGVRVQGTAGYTQNVNLLSKVLQSGGQIQTGQPEKQQAVYKRRSSKDLTPAARNAVVDQFNDGGYDGLVVNQSGASGISAHASVKAKDKRQRHMVIAQPESNIDTVVQLLGRINRTGQVVLPEYTQLVADIPAEKRPAAVLLRKLASLNANTTAARGGALSSKDVVDFMNRYGDEVTAQVMFDNQDLHDMLGRPLDLNSARDGYEPAGAAALITGKLPLLENIEDQERVYNQIEYDYKELLARLDAMGENALEAKTLDLDARTISSEPVFRGSGTSPFARNADAETVDVKRIGKPFTTDQVMTQLQNHLDLPDANLKEIQQWGKDEAAHRAEEQTANFDEYIRNLREAASMGGPLAVANIASAVQRAEGVQREWNTRNRMLHVGATLRVAGNGIETWGVVTKVQQRGEPSNPMALGSWRVTIALTDSSRQVTIPFSRLFPAGSVTRDMEAGGRLTVDPAEHATIMGPSGITRVPVMDAFDKSQIQAREQRVMITGNLPAGFSRFQRGRIVNYTNDKGEIKQGILMARGFNLAAALDATPVTFKDPAHVVDFLIATGFQGLVKSSDGVLRISGTNNRDVVFSVPSSRRTGGQYFLDTDITDAADKDFVTSGKTMKLTVDLTTAKQVARVIIDKGTSLEADNHKDTARTVTGETPPSGARPGGSQRGMVDPAMLGIPQMMKAVDKVIENLKKAGQITSESAAWATSVLADIFTRNGQELEFKNEEAFEEFIKASGTNAQVYNMMRSVIPEIERVTGKPITDFIKILADSRLQGVKERYESIAAEVTAISEDDLLDAYGQGLGHILENIAGKRDFSKDLKAEADTLLANGDIDGLRNFIVDNLYEAASKVARLMTDGEFKDAIKDPGFKEGLKIYKEHIEKPIAKNHASNEGVFSDALGPLDTYYPLIAKDENGNLVHKQGPVPSRRAPLQKPKNPSNYWATGLSEDYSTEAADLVNELKKDFKANNIGALYGFFEKVGMATRYKSGDVPEGFVKQDAGPYIMILSDGRQIRVPPRQVLIEKYLWKTIKPLVEGRTRAEGKFWDATRAVTGFGLVGLIDPAIHSHNIINTMTTSTPFIFKDPLTRTFGNMPLLKALDVAINITTNIPIFTKPIAAGVKVAITSTKGDHATKQKQRLANAGALPEKTGSVTYSPTLARQTGAELKGPAAIWKPELRGRNPRTGKRKGIVRAAMGSVSLAPFLIGPAGFDTRARIALLDILDAMKVNPTNTEIFNFVNNIGIYNYALESRLGRFVKDYGIGPFYSASSARLRNGIRAATLQSDIPGTERTGDLTDDEIEQLVTGGKGGGKNKGKYKVNYDYTGVDAASYKISQALSAGILGFATVWALAYFAYRKKWPYMEPGTRLGEIALRPEHRKSALGQALCGPGEDTCYIGLGFGSVIPNALHALGISGYMNTIAAGGDSGQGLEKAATDAINSFAQPVSSGPLLHAGFTAVSGQDLRLTGFRDVTGKKGLQFAQMAPSRPPGMPQFSSNLVAATLAVNSLARSVADIGDFGPGAPAGKERSGRGKALQMAINLAAPGLIKGTADLDEQAIRYARQRQATDEDTTKPLRDQFIDRLRKETDWTQANADISKAQTEGKLAVKDVQEIYSKGKETGTMESFKSLGVKAAIDAFEHVSPEKQEELFNAGVLGKKRSEVYTDLPDTPARDALLQRYDKLLDAVNARVQSKPAGQVTPGPKKAVNF